MSTISVSSTDSYNRDGTAIAPDSRIGRYEVKRPPLRLVANDQMGDDVARFIYVPADLETG